MGSQTIMALRTVQTRRLSVPGVTACLAVLLGAVPVLAEQTIELALERSKWENKAFADPAEETGGVEAASFDLIEDATHGPCLAIGPFRSGRWGIRMQYRQSLPMTRCVVRGLYRTEGLLPYSANVEVHFSAGSERGTRRTLWLAPSNEWRPFEFSIWSAQPGADRCAPSFGLGSKTEGRVLFAKLSISDEVGEFQVPARLPDLARPAPQRWPAGKFFRLEKSGETWWLVTPEGKPFYSLGVDGSSFSNRQQGLERARWLESHGFNSLGGWSSMSSWGPLNDSLATEGGAFVAGFHSLQSASIKEPYDRLMDSQGQLKDGEHGFPDPFDPQYARAYRARVKRIAEQVRDRPWFVAWFADNEIAHRDLHRYVYSRHCSEAFGRFLRSRYNTIDALNAAWKANFASVEDLLARKPEPGPAGTQKHQDFKAFAREIVRKYIEVTLGAIRAEDPDHLVFSNRFMVGEFSDLPDLLDLYSAYDGIGFNIYPQNQRLGLDETELAALRMVYEKTGRPLLISEWSIPAIDSGLYESAKTLDWSWDRTVLTQQHRAAQAARVTAEFHNLPFVVGSHWFTLRDFDNEKRQANRGLLKADGRPWDELLQALGAVQRRLAPPE